MKLIHLSDLHLGKRLNDFSLLDDQEYILGEILQIIDSEQPDGIIIAGDIYDKSVPPTEAVTLLDKFLNELANRKIQVLIISGNHDCPERLSFGGRLIESSGIHIAPVYNGKIEPLLLSDKNGAVNIYMLPFIKPAIVRRFFPNDTINDYTDAMRIAIEQMNLNLSERNILVSHQFVTGAIRSDSEQITVGGLDNVSASVFDDFDYVALGHIHMPQSIAGKKTIRYCGTPLKYSFSEANQKKSVTVVTLEEKGNVKIHTVPLTPKRDLLELHGTFNTLTAKNYYEGTSLPESFVHVVLTDEQPIPFALSKMREIYPYILKLEYDNTTTRNKTDFVKTKEIKDTPAEELFADFFKERTGKELDEEQRSYILKITRKIKEAVK